MEILESPDVVLVAGDWHGNVPWMKLIFQYAFRSGADCILHAGDFGFWTPGYDTDRYLNSVEREAQEWGIPLYWVDGNHEDHSRTAEFNDPTNRPMTTHLPRGTRWAWWDKTFMALGGAYSVDRFARSQGIGWWPEEELSEEQIKYASREGKVDVVVAHDCPTGVYIPGVGADLETQHRGLWPDDMLYGASLHRNQVKRVWEATRPKMWIHGHYHRHYEMHHQGTHFVGLDCDSTTVKENAMILTANDA